MRTNADFPAGPRPVVQLGPQDVEGAPWSAYLGIDRGLWGKPAHEASAASLIAQRQQAPAALYRLEDVARSGYRIPAAMPAQTSVASRANAEKAVLVHERQ